MRSRSCRSMSLTRHFYKWCSSFFTRVPVRKAGCGNPDNMEPNESLGEFACAAQFALTNLVSQPQHEHETPCLLRPMTQSPLLRRKTVAVWREKDVYLELADKMCTLAIPLPRSGTISKAIKPFLSITSKAHWPCCRSVSCKGVPMVSEKL